MKNKEQEKTLPCPFCGGSENIKSGDNWNGLAYVHCYLCGGHMDQNSEGAAIRMWNTRAKMIDSISEGEIMKKQQKPIGNCLPVNIIFDGPPSHEGGRFIEVETDDGKSINAGEWLKRDDGLWALRITVLPTIKEEKLTREEKRLANLVYSQFDPIL